jgi:hypothetical protein
VPTGHLIYTRQQVRNSDTYSHRFLGTLGLVVIKSEIQDIDQACCGVFSNGCCDVLESRHGQELVSTNGNAPSIGELKPAFVRASSRPRLQLLSTPPGGLSFKINVVPKNWD